MKKLPDVPGVYFFKKGKNILYIGKATSLRSRVRSYFAKDISETRGPKIVKMLEEASSISWEETDSVLEALILEANLIKQHQPLYNTDEKDDKSWNHLVITDEKFPRVLIVRGRNLGEFTKRVKIKRSFGPFLSGGALREALKIVRRIFPYFDTKQPVTESDRKRLENRFAFNRQIGLFPKELDERSYARNVKHIMTLFSGKKTALVRDLERDMRGYVKSEEFEKANEAKHQLFALEHIRDVTLIKEELRVARHADAGGPAFRIEAYDVAHLRGGETVGVMTVVEDGEAERNEYRKFKIRSTSSGDDIAALKELLTRRLKHPEWRLPDLIVIDGGKTHLSAARKIVGSSHPDIPLVSVVKDERHRPRDILGSPDLARQHETGILKANAEAHRFAISWHRNRLRNAFV